MTPGARSSRRQRRIVTSPLRAPGYTRRMTNNETMVTDDRDGAVDDGAGISLDGLVPEQLLPLQRLLRLQPEARLALAVLEDAAATLRSTHGVETLRARRLASQTWTWFESDATHHPFAFRVICQHLDLDAEWLRQGLARWQPPVTPFVVDDSVHARKRRRAA